MILRSFKLTMIFMLISFLFSQVDKPNKKRKIYRTQTGSIIEAPKPLFERPVIQSKSKKKSRSSDKVKVSRPKVVESNYKNELDSLKSKLNFLLDQSKELKNNYEEKLSERLVDTLFVYTTLYDTTTNYDTTFIYTNATTTVYDTVLIIDSIYINNYDTTTIIQNNYDTTIVLDTTLIFNYDTVLVKDTIWAFAYDTTFLYDTTWVYAHDTTVLRDSIWLFAVDTLRIYDTLVVSKNDTVTIHSYSSNFPTNFTPDMANKKQSAFPKYKTLGDALKARDTGDTSVQGWINQALNAAQGNWKQAETEYLKLQEIYSTAVVQAITAQPKSPNFVGPEMKYRSVVFDTLKILTFDTTLVQDTLRNLVKQTYVKYDTSVIEDRREVIAHTTPPGHELIIKYHNNGRPKEKGLMKDRKRNGDWTYYDRQGRPLRKTTYEMGKLINDELIVLTKDEKEKINPMEKESGMIKKDKRSKKSKSKKSNNVFTLPKFGDNN